MLLDYSTLENALQQLEISMNFYHSEMAQSNAELKDQFRNSAIQCFKFTYELSFKIIRRQLEKTSNFTHEIRQMNFADFIRTAADADLVPDVKRFLQYRLTRSLTSQSYNKERAEEIIVILPQFIEDVHIILSKIKIKNESEI